MWKLLFALAALALGSLPAQAADQAFVLAACGTPTGAAYNIPGYGPLSIDQTGKLCVNATVSTSGFTPSASGSTGTPLSVTTSSGSTPGALPTGAVVILTNAGTVTAYCALGATATTSSQPIVGGGSFAFTVGSATQFTCITATGTTTINSLGGSGTPAFSGGGGGTGGGTVTIGAPLGTGAPAVGVTVTLDSTDAAALLAPIPYMAETTWATSTPISTGATGPGISDLQGAAWVDIGAVAGVAIGAMANYGTSPGAVKVQGVNAFVTNSSADPCVTGTMNILPFTIPTNTTTNILTGTSAKKIYVCYWYTQTGLANNIAIIEGTTGATCGSGTKALVGGTTAATGLLNAANSGQAMGNGGYTVMQTTVSNNDICVITSASGPLAGVMKYVLQ